MGVVAIGGLLPLALGRQRVIIMVTSMIFFFGFWMVKFEFQTKTAGESRSLSIHHGKHHLSCC
jgi:hypothetical protein